MQTVCGATYKFDEEFDQLKCEDIITIQINNNNQYIKVIIWKISVLLFDIMQCINVLQTCYLISFLWLG